MSESQEVLSKFLRERRRNEEAATGISSGDKQLFFIGIVVGTFLSLTTALCILITVTLFDNDPVPLIGTRPTRDILVEYGKKTIQFIKEREETKFFFVNQPTDG